MGKIFLRGAVSEAKIFIGKYAPGKLEFQDGCEGGGAQSKNLTVGEVCIFCGTLSDRTTR